MPTPSDRVWGLDLENRTMMRMVMTGQIYMYFSFTNTLDSSLENVIYIFHSQILSTQV